MFTIIQEKEERIREMMKMNGMKMRAYWFSVVAFNLAVYAATSLVFWSFGFFVLSLEFFWNSNALPLVILLGGWGIAQIGMAIFFSVFINSTKTSSIFGYMLSLILVVISSGYNGIVYALPHQIPSLYLLVPHFSFSRILYIFNIVATDDRSVTLGTFLEEPQCLLCLLLLYGVGLGLGVLGIYLNEIIQQTYGVKRHPLFFLMPKGSKKGNGDIPEPIRIERRGETQEEDEDCSEEREAVERIVASEDTSHFPLVIRNARKVYKARNGESSRTAVRSFSLSVREGETFGLLGPNGAGKFHSILSFKGVGLS